MIFSSFNDIYSLALPIGQLDRNFCLDIHESEDDNTSGHLSLEEKPSLRPVVGPVLIRILTKFFLAPDTPMRTIDRRSWQSPRFNDDKHTLPINHYLRNSQIRFRPT